MESFREWFRGHEDSYVLMGEAAGDLLRSERGLDRGTVKEMDLVLLDQDRDYDSLIRQERTAAFGISVLTVPCLIVLEAKAWMDLSDRKEAGEEIKSREIEKHKNLAFSLTGLLSDAPRSLCRCRIRSGPT